MDARTDVCYHTMMWWDQPAPKNKTKGTPAPAKTRNQPVPAEKARGTQAPKTPWWKQPAPEKTADCTPASALAATNPRSEPAKQNPMDKAKGIPAPAKTRNQPVPAEKAQGTQAPKTPWWKQPAPEKKTDCTPASALAATNPRSEPAKQHPTEARSLEPKSATAKIVVEGTIDKLEQTWGIVKSDTSARTYWYAANACGLLVCVLPDRRVAQPCASTDSGRCEYVCVWVSCMCMQVQLWFELSKTD